MTPTTQRQLSIVCIEDNPMDVLMVRSLLERLPAPVRLTTTHDMETGAALVRAENADLVIVDYSLPGSSRMDSLARISKLGAPVIAFSGEETHEAAQVAGYAGAAAFVAKWHAHTNLLPAIYFILGQSERGQDGAAAERYFQEGRPS